MDDLRHKAVEKLKQGVDFLRERATETVEVQKTNAHIKELQKRREECIMDLGWRVYAMMQQGNVDPKRLRPKFLEALDYEKAIERNQKEITNIRGRLRKELEVFMPEPPKRCPKCGEASMALQKYCKECGTSLEPQPGGRLTTEDVEAATPPGADEEPEGQKEWEL